MKDCDTYLQGKQEDGRRVKDQMTPLRKTAIAA